MSVYVITCRDLGVAKIGYSNAPLRRIDFLQTGSPAPIKLEAVIPACEQNERELHAAFSEHRAHGEWFRICAGIETLIAKFAASKGGKRRLFPDSPLSRYLVAHGLTAQAFAATVGTTAGSMSRILNGRQDPSFGMIRAIVDATNGSVTADDLVFGVPRWEKAA